jgi:hypothetical protein
MIGVYVVVSLWPTRSRLDLGKWENHKERQCHIGDD